MPGHTHDCSSSWKEIDAKPWEFLSRERLPADGTFRVYADPKPAN